MLETPTRLAPKTEEGVRVRGDGWGVETKACSNQAGNSNTRLLATLGDSVMVASGKSGGEQGLAHGSESGATGRCLQGLPRQRRF